MSSRSLLTVLLVTVLSSVAYGANRPGGGKVFLTKEEALELVFEDCEVERVTATLDSAAKKRISELSGGKFGTSVVFAYRATKDGEPVGTAYFDVHRVRTMRETIMVVVDPQERVSRIEVLAFAEPLDYLPRAKWYAQFQGKKLDDELSMKRGIRGVTGATLTARATTDAVRRVLAVHRVRLELAAKKKTEKKKVRRAEKKGTPGRG